MIRYDIISEVSRSDGLIVSNIGFPSRELYSVADSPKNFYMTGSMGLASSIGLGLSMSQKKKVYVIDGDGSVLMNLGTLVTVAHNAPDNFSLIIVDNMEYGSTGGQATYTSCKADLEMIARGAGNTNVICVDNIEQLCQAMNRYTEVSSVIVARAQPGNRQVPVIPFTPVEIKNRFMDAIRERD